MKKEITPEEIISNILKISQISSFINEYEKNGSTIPSEQVTTLGTLKLIIANWLEKEDNYETIKKYKNFPLPLLQAQLKHGYFEKEFTKNSPIAKKIMFEPVDVTVTIPTPKQAITIHDEIGCFNKQFKNMIANLPDATLIKEIIKTVSIVKENPHFLKDNPNHFLCGRGHLKNKAPTIQEFSDVVKKYSFGDIEAATTIKEYHKLFTDFYEKAGIISEIEIQKAKMSNQSKNQLKM